MKDYGFDRPLMLPDIGMSVEGHREFGSCFSPKLRRRNTFCNCVHGILGVWCLAHCSILTKSLRITLPASAMCRCFPKRYLLKGMPSSRTSFLLI